MNYQKRRAIAFIGGCLISKLRTSFVYDLATLSSHNMSGEVKDNFINIYDSDRLNHLNGSSTDGVNYTVFDYATNSNIDLKISGNHFSGIDHESTFKFNASVGRNLVAFLDDEDKLYHNYRLD